MCNSGYENDCEKRFIQTDPQVSGRQCVLNSVRSNSRYENDRGKRLIKIASKTDSGVVELPHQSQKRKGDSCIKRQEANIRNVVPVLRCVLRSQLHPKPCQVYDDDHNDDDNNDDDNNDDNHDHCQ